MPSDASIARYLDKLERRYVRRTIHVNGWRPVVVADLKVWRWRHALQSLENTIDSITFPRG